MCRHYIFQWRLPVEWELMRDPEEVVGAAKLAKRQELAQVQAVA
jgi:hypothetical protein